jgi:hypothetical protein
MALLPALDRVSSIMNSRGLLRRGGFATGHAANTKHRCKETEVIVAPLEIARCSSPYGDIHSAFTHGDVDPVDRVAAAMKARRGDTSSMPDQIEARAARHRALDGRRLSPTLGRPADWRCRTPAPTMPPDAPLLDDRETIQQVAISRSLAGQPSPILERATHRSYNPNQLANLTDPVPEEITKRPQEITTGVARHWLR